MREKKRTIIGWQLQNTPFKERVKWHIQGNVYLLPLVLLIVMYLFGLIEIV